MSIEVEVIYALPNRAIAVSFSLQSPATVADAVSAARADERFADVPFDAGRVGVFGELCDGSRALVNGDRVELYRPLRVDPKDTRRLRAEHQRAERLEKRRR